MRTFVAIEVDQSCRQKLKNAIEALKPVADGVRWVNDNALHLTLKFIGELGEKELPTAISTIQNAATESSPFNMEVAGISGFPPHGTPKVVFAAVKEPEGILEHLHESVDERLHYELGVKQENRKFVPHITLGRVKKRGKAPTLSEMQDAIKEDYFGAVAAGSMELIKSELTPDGPVYTSLHEFTLGG